MEVLQYSDYRSFLKDELERRMGINAGYSLRAFARDLKMSPQNLSSLLKGKKGISAEAAATMADRLEMNPQEASYFLDLVSLAHARNPQARKIAEFRVQQHRTSQKAYSSI